MHYVIRKREQKWVVCAESGLLEFEEFQEAFRVAWSAAHVLASIEKRDAQPDGGHGHAYGRGS